MKAVYIEQTCGPEMTHYGDQPKPEAAAGQLLIKVEATGVNFIDTYHRSGLYKIPLPGILGTEGAGRVEAVGTVSPGSKRRPRRLDHPRGSYAEYAAVPENFVVKVPEGVSSRDAAAAMLQGMTAHYLSHSTFALKPGQTALHSRSGRWGTGRLLVQMAKMLGARVLATVGSEAKAAVAKQAGADEVINYSTQDFVAEVKRLTDGKGVEVVYDSVGLATFLKSLECLKIPRHDGRIRKRERSSSSH